MENSVHPEKIEVEWRTITTYFMIGVIGCLSGPIVVWFVSTDSVITLRCIPGFLLLAIGIFGLYSAITLLQAKLRGQRVRFETPLGTTLRRTLWTMAIVYGAVMVWTAAVFHYR